MKFRLFLIIFIGILTTYPILSFGQDTVVIIENLQEKKVSYTFLNEYGMYAGWDVGATGVFVNGICFNKTQDEIGIGVGCEFGVASGLSFPIFINYRHYFPKREKIQPLINVAVGTRLTSWYGTGPWYPAFYSVVAAGFRVKAFSFNSGIYVKSLAWNKYHNTNDFFGGVEIKLGYTLNYNKKQSHEKK